MANGGRGQARLCLTSARRLRDSSPNQAATGHYAVGNRSCAASSRWDWGWCMRTSEVEPVRAPMTAAGRPPPRGGGRPRHVHCGPERGKTRWRWSPSEPRVAGRALRPSRGLGGARSPWVSDPRVDLDFIDHQLVVRTSEERRGRCAQDKVRAVFDEYRAILVLERRRPKRTIRRRWRRSPLRRDRTHLVRRDAAQRCWRRCPADGPARLPRPVPRQVQPRPLLVGRLRPVLHALLGPTRAPAPWRYPEPPRLDHARGLLARVHQRGVVARRRRAERAGLLRLCLPRAGGIARGKGAACCRLLPHADARVILPYDACAGSAPTRPTGSSRTRTRRRPTSRDGTAARWSGRPSLRRRRGPGSGRCPCRR